MSYIDYDLSPNENTFSNLMDKYFNNDHSRSLFLEIYIDNNYNNNNITDLYIKKLKYILKRYENIIESILTDIKYYGGGNLLNKYYNMYIFYRQKYHKYLIYGIKINSGFFINKRIIYILKEYDLINNDIKYAKYLIDKNYIISKNVYLSKLQNTVLTWFNKSMHYNYSPIIYNYIVFTNPQNIYNRDIKKMLKLCVQNIHATINSYNTDFAIILKNKINLQYPLFNINKYIIYPER